ncbi:MAG: histidine--tRNA ligase [Flavobacteriales bacterium]
MSQKPAIPKGTRDFSPREMVKRKHIIRVIEKKFQRYGYAPIETPSFENRSTLMGKYGEAGDRLIFKILDSGDFLKQADKDAWAQGNSNAFANSIAGKALRYDLTVPLARYVVQHQSEIGFPFKRYQIQAVWRADRPQKGRFREFYQCDADVVGSDSLWQEVELVQLYDDVFNALHLPVCIRVNNRRLLAGLAEVAGISEQFVHLTAALDKWDKTGCENAVAEMGRRGIPQSAIDTLATFFQLDTASNWERIHFLEAALKSSETGQKGIGELRFILEKIQHYGLKIAELDLDPTLARGLDYYTGTIFEVVGKGIALGSLGGGGRYDELTGIFGLSDRPGVGISFGLDRIYLALEEKGLFPDLTGDKLQLLFIHFGAVEAAYSYRLVAALRNRGINCELYPEAAKLKKQLAYAHKNQVPYVALAGSQEVASQTVTLKNMRTGQQQTLTQDNFLSGLKDLLADTHSRPKL